MRTRLATVSCLLALCAPLLALAQESKPITIIEPKQQPRAVKSATIDTEKFQLGATLGTLAVEDFNNNLLTGLSATYQLHKSWLLAASYATSEVGRSTFEKREGLDFLTDAQREFSYFSLGAGYRLYAARSFWGASRKYDSDIYVFGGLGSYDFAGDSNPGFNLGVSYRVVLTDWLVATADFKDHIVEVNDVFGSGTKRTQNLEFSFGLNALFF